MKNRECDIVCDILPLYIDDVVSNNTRQFVDDHIRKCDDCKKVCETMKKDILRSANKDENLDNIASLKSFRKFMRKRKFITMLVSIFLTAVVIVGVSMALTIPRIYIPYHEEYFNVEVDNGEVYLNSDLTYYNGIVAHDPVEMIINNNEESITMVYYYYSPWSKYIEPLFKSNNDESEYKEKKYYLGTVEEVSQVYYGEFNKSANFNEDLLSTLEGLELVWED